MGRRASDFIRSERCYTIRFRLAFSAEDMLVPLALSEFVVIESANSANNRPGTAR
jgi:hypothetical protein